MFIFNKFTETLKSKNISLKTIVYGSLATLILATSVISNNAGNNVFFALQTGISKISSYNVNVNLKNKLENSNLEKINVSYQQIKGFGKKNYHTMLVSSIDNTNKIIEISEIGEFFDLFTDHIKIGQNVKESSFLESLSFVTKLGFVNEVNLEMPKGVKKIISVDVENFNSPSLTYTDNNDVIHYDTINRHGILDNAKSIFLTEEQYQSLNDKEKLSIHRVDNKEGLTYNGRIESRFNGNAQIFVLPKDYKEIISISKDGIDKLISYINKDGALKISIFNDFNLNTEYNLVDSSNKNFYNDSIDNNDKFVNLNLVNKLTNDNSSKAITLKTNIKKEDIKQILNIDSNGGSFTFSYIDNNNVIQTQDIGKTLGIFEGKTIFSGVNIKSNLNTNYSSQLSNK